jgi:hypothetical protein
LTILEPFPRGMRASSLEAARTQMIGSPHGAVADLRDRTPQVPTMRLTRAPARTLPNSGNRPPADRSGACAVAAWERPWPPRVRWRCW